MSEPVYTLDLGEEFVVAALDCRPAIQFWRSGFSSSVKSQWAYFFPDSRVQMRRWQYPIALWPIKCSMLHRLANTLNFLSLSA
jgi:hypothetical protein